MKLRHELFALILAYGCGMAAQTASDTVYVWKEDLPDGGYFLPAPPDTASADFVDDMVQWQWGKTQRPLERGKQASRESLWKPAIMRTVIAEVLGLDTISDEATPAMARLLNKSFYAGDQSTAGPKLKYKRTRPFVRMHEDTWGQWDDDFLRTNGSYPSGHTAFGWATALAFAEMWPELQDTLLRRGFQFGENRIITGAHYQSDVYAGYMCGAAAIAQTHVNPAFEDDIRAARAEYIALKGLPADYDPAASVGYPHGEKILNAHVDAESHRYMADIMRYWDAKHLRDSVEGERARHDANVTINSLCSIFGQVVGVKITEAATPKLYQYVFETRKAASNSSKELKATTFRIRPYALFGDATLVPGDEEGHRASSSYASSHSCIGWAIALALAEVVPDRQDDILRRGFEYGQGRLIAGYHWATDIEAARLLACAVVARLHANPSYLELIKEARQEFEEVKEESDLPVGDSAGIVEDYFATVK